MKLGFEHLPDESERYIDHPAHAKPGIHVYPDRLYALTVLENPLRLRARYKNFWRFHSMCERAGVILYVAEIAFGGRAWEITESGNPQHLQLRGHDELLHKENSLNLLIQCLPHSANYIATLDADINFTRPDWAQETLHLLQHYKVLQMFSHAMDLGPNDEPLDINEGFVMHELSEPPHNPERKKQWQPEPNPHYSGGRGKYKLWHPGLAWAYRKTALNQLGGLMDWVMGGSADHYQSLALFNKIARTNLNLREFPEGYRRPCFEWQARAERHIRRNVGYMPGTVLHYWHGPKARRQYLSRAKMLARFRFDPGHDLKRDWQGLWELQDWGDLRSIQIRDGLRHFARLRDEDSMSLNGDN